jgi:hypothetical protein
MESERWIASQATGYVSDILQGRELSDCVSKSIPARYDDRVLTFRQGAP